MILRAATLTRMAIIILFPLWLLSCSHGSHAHSDEEEMTEHEDHSGHDHEHDHDHEEGHSHEGELIIEPGKAAEMGITTEEVKAGEFEEVIKTSGRIEPAATDIMTISAKKSGIVTLAPGISVGMRVNAGSRLATISSAGIEGGDINAAAKANLEAAKREVERLKPLYDDGLVTASVYNEARRVYEESLALAYSTPSGGATAETVPSFGTLTSLAVTSGQYVEAGAPLATVTKSSKLTLSADLPARHAAKIQMIKDANFRPDSSDEVFSISELGGGLVPSGSFVTDNNGFATLYFTFESVPQTLPGAFAEIYLIGAKREGVITVPAQSIIELQGNKYVYVVEDGHAYEKKLIKTGGSDGRRVEITEGLEPGETVVSKGAAVVRMAETAAIAPPSHTHNH